MNGLLWAYGRRMLAWLAACLLAVFAALAAAGHAALIGAVLLGCLTGALCAWILAWRTWKSLSLDVGKAKRQMLIGFFLRLLAIALVFGAAAQISAQVFWAVVGGFFLFFLLAMLHLMRFSLAYGGEKRPK